MWELKAAEGQLSVKLRTVCEDRKPEMGDEGEVMHFEVRAFLYKPSLSCHPHSWPSTPTSSHDRQCISAHIHCSHP